MSVCLLRAGRTIQKRDYGRKKESFLRLFLEEAPSRGEPHGWTGVRTKNRSRPRRLFRVRIGGKPCEVSR